MKTTKIRIISAVVFAVLVGVWAVLLCAFSDNYQELFPGRIYEPYVLTDAPAGGFSTSEISVKDSSISANVNVRSGMAYPYAGFGLNLMSVGNRPAASFFDFSRFDTIAVRASAGRMTKLTLRVMTEDVQYSRKGEYLSYRPLLASLPVSSTIGEVKVALSDFKVPEQWLVAHGLDHDDGFTYWDRAVLFEVSNGEGALRGIPDEFEIRSISMYGENRGFKNAMYAVLAFLILAFGAVFVVSGRKTRRGDA